MTAPVELSHGDCVVSPWQRQSAIAMEVLLVPESALCVLCGHFPPPTMTLVFWNSAHNSFIAF